MGVRETSVLIAGALSNTGQLVARSLSLANDTRVMAMCGPDMGRLISDDTGPLSTTAVQPIGAGVRADALVVATDDPPPLPTLRRLLEVCTDVPHTVLLSRLGASTGAMATSAWQEVEEAATECCPNLTIVRMGEPLIGGPFYKTDADTIAWSKAKVADNMLSATVTRGDDQRQSGFGSSRAVAASAIGAALRRGPEQQVAYAVTSTDLREKTESAEYDALFERAAGGAPSTAEDGATRQTAEVRIDVGEELLKPLTEPYKPPPPTPLQLLQANFFGNPSVAGPNWFILIAFVAGMYQARRQPTPPGGARRPSPAARALSHTCRVRALRGTVHSAGVHRADGHRCLRTRAGLRDRARRRESAVALLMVILLTGGRLVWTPSDPAVP